MTATDRSLFHDTDLMDTLMRDPELLALADALVATKSSPVAPKPLFRRHRHVKAVAGALAGVAAIVALLLISPWQREPSFVAKAMAAIGGEPVLHVVVTEPFASDQTLINIKTGQASSRTLTTEVWFDEALGSKKTISTVDGQTVDELLETDQGSWTQAGPVYTCAWISAHPLDASKVGVSCNANGQNPPGRVIPETTPTLDPALANFVDHYQSALASGKAQQLGPGKFEGHTVFWLQFRVGGISEKVGVDANSYAPIVIVQPSSKRTLRVLRAETVGYNEIFFTRPEKVRAQTGDTVTSEEALSPPEASAVLGGRALWLGQSWRGLKLVSATHEQRTIAYGPGEQLGETSLVKFSYAASRAESTLGQRARIDIYEASGCLVSIGWTCTARDPRVEDTLQSRGPVSLLLANGLHVSVWNFGSDPSRSSLSLARDLLPLTAAARSSG